MKRGWLLRQGDVLCAAEVAESTGERSKGLLGRSGYDGAMILAPARSVHTFFMGFPLDVAFVTDELEVVDLVAMARWRVSLPRRRARRIIEAEAGSFERWGLAVGDRLEFRLAER